MNSKYKEVIERLFLIKKHELARFLYTASLIFLIAYIHNLLRTTRDILIIRKLGTELISAIKIWFAIPISLLLTVVYVKLSAVLNRAKLFHIMNIFLISYFVIFTLFLYPNRDLVSITSINSLAINLPSLKYFVLTIANWPLSLFYAFSESWVTIMLSIMFWQIANHITSVEESKRFYFFFGFIAQLGFLLSSMSTVYIAKKYSGENWQPTLNSITICIIISGVLLSISLFKLEKIIGHKKFNFKDEMTEPKKKIGIKQSLTYLMSSKPILFITSSLLCYNIASNIIEDILKKTLEISSKRNPGTMQIFISNANIFAAILSLILAILGVYLIRKWEWKTVALITPVLSIITGSMLFIALAVLNYKNPDYYDASPLISAAMFFGVINNILVRTTKHTIFDATKEAIYIPLNNTLKTQGKAASEAIGMGVGKGMGSFIEQVILMLRPASDLLRLSSIFSIIFLIISLWWIYSTIALSKLLKFDNSKNI